MTHVRDISVPLPQPDPGAAAKAHALAKRSAGILICLPAGSDPPATAARFVWPIRRAPWAAYGWLARNGTVLEIRDVGVAATPPGTALTSDILRRVSTTAILSAAQAHFALMDAATAELATATGAEPSAGTAQAAAATLAGPGRRPLPQNLLRDTAEAFLQEAPHGPGVHDRIALRLQRQHGRTFTSSQIRHAIGRAQAGGWLSEGRPGSAQREPGAMLLAQREKERA